MRDFTTGVNPFGALTIIFQRIKQPVVLGYLLAGMIVGSHLPVPLFANEKVAHTLSELGVILLMFSLGLEFSLRKLVRVGATAGFISVIQCSLMLLLGYLTGLAFGWTPMESLFTGAVVVVSSTTIIMKAFSEEGVTGKLAELVFGILIFEDLGPTVWTRAQRDEQLRAGFPTIESYRGG
jgi:CPA2 family monovalent cation:H+ antiporter-2